MTSPMVAAMLEVFVSHRAEKQKNQIDKVSLISKKI
jgi:hypothetical protein